MDAFYDLGDGYEALEELHASASPDPTWRSGPGTAQCQVEGCEASLEGERKYCLNKRICNEHLKAEHVTRAGFSGLWRFCFQCSKLEPLEDFEGARRTCRARLQRRRLPRRSSSWTAGLVQTAATMKQQHALSAEAAAAAYAAGSSFAPSASAYGQLVARHSEIAQMQQRIQQLQAQLAAVRTGSSSTPGASAPLPAAISHSLTPVVASSAGPAHAPLPYVAAGNQGQAWPPGGVLAAQPASASAAAAAAAAAAPMAPQLVPWPRPAAAHAGHLHCVPEDDLLGLLSGIEADIEGGEDPLALELIQTLDTELAGLKQECAAAPAVPHAGSVASAGTAFVPAAAPAAVQTSQLAPQQLAACVPGLAPGVPAAAFATSSLACPAAGTASPVVVAAAPLPPPQCQMGWASQLAAAPGVAQLSPAAQAARLAWLAQRNAQLGGAQAWGCEHQGAMHGAGTGVKLE